MNEKTKNSLSDKRGSIVRSIDKLASSIVSDEVRSDISASMMPMMPMLQMQQLQQMEQAFLQSQIEFQMRGIEERLPKDMNRKEHKKKKRRKKARKKRKAAVAGSESKADDSSLSSSSSSDGS